MSPRISINNGQVNKIFSGLLKDIPLAQKNWPSNINLDGQDIFCGRLLSALKSGYFERYFGRRVNLIDIVEAGDKHLLLEANITDISRFGDESIQVERGDDLDELFERIETGENFKVFSLSYWKKINGLVKKIKRSYLAQIPFVQQADSENVKLNYFGTQLAQRLLQEGSYLIDSTKKLVFRDETSKEYRIIYKPYSAVRIEKEMLKIFKLLGYPVDYRIDIEQDSYGDFAFIEYIDTYRINLNTGFSLKLENARELGRLMVIFYLLGGADLTSDNLLLSEKQRLIPIDLETVFSGQFVEKFEDFQREYFERNKESVFRQRQIYLKKEFDAHIAAEYNLGVSESCEAILSQEERLKEAIESIFSQDNLKARRICADTREYNENILLRFVVPYYLMGFAQEEKIKLKEKFFSRIDELKVKAAVRGFALSVDKVQGGTFGIPGLKEHGVVNVFHFFIENSI